MKKACLFVLLLVAAAGCRGMEEDFNESLPSGRPFKLVSVPVSFSGGESTKSVAGESVEGFRDAYLFALWASGEDAGKPCIVENTPLAIFTDDKDFQWNLPAEEEITVLAIVNADNSARSLLDGWLSGRESFGLEDFSSLTFSCRSASELQALQTEGSNMPMTGNVTVTLDPDSPSLNIPVKRLFAKFDIKLDVSDWADEGWTVTAASVTGAKSNTEVPYFHTGSGPGFKQTDPSKLAAVDSSTDEDLTRLNFRDKRNRSLTVSYYFLENCQAVEESAGRWNTVYPDLGSLVDNCSFLKIMVRASKTGYGTRSFGYRIYLDSVNGSSMNSGFNIIRNTYRSITLKLGTPQDGFRWTNTASISFDPGQTVTIPFETSLEGGELVFTPETTEIAFLSYSMGTGEGEHLTSFPNWGNAVFRARGDAIEGEYSITGGNSSRDISDELTVQVNPAININFTLPASRYAFQRFAITLSSDSMEGWTSAQKSRMEGIFYNLSMRPASDDAHFIMANPTYHTSLNGSGDVVNKQVVVMSTRSGVASFEIYNTSTNVVYKRIYISITQPRLQFIQTRTGAYADNSFSHHDLHISDGPIYSTSFTGETAKGYFQICDQSGNALAINAADLALGTLEMTSINGFSFNVNTTPDASKTYSFSGSLDTWAYLDGLKSNVDYSSGADACTFWDEYFSPTLRLLSESDVTVCEEPVVFNVTNPFLEWFPDKDSKPFGYTVTLDGSTDFTSTEDFSTYWPAGASITPQVMSHGNITTSKAGYAPYSLLWDYTPDAINKVRIANDLRNYGRINIGNTITHSTSGETLTMIWGRINVIRDYIIYVGYQFSQVNYLTSYTIQYDSGKLSRFIPYVFLLHSEGAPTALSTVVGTTATAATGINAVNPSEEFYKATCAAEHWWPEHTNNSSYDHTSSTLWDCEHADFERKCLLQNSVVVYPSPKTVTSNGELSYYELQYAGPIVTQNSFYLGHQGLHANNIYSFRSVAFWNEPAFEFTPGKINPSFNPVLVTDARTGEQYLQLGDFTRYRFFWKMKKATLDRINGYDTRYAINYSQVFQLSYFGTSTYKSASTTTAYLDPRRSSEERMKLYTPFIPYYRVVGTTVHEAFDGSFTGSYKEENVYDSHIFGQAYGEEDSFWLPGNQIQ